MERGGWEQSGALESRLNPAFSGTMTMSEFAAAVRRLGARPGLWFRSADANADQPQSWRLQRDPKYLDPTVPQVRALIRQDVKRFAAGALNSSSTISAPTIFERLRGMDMNGSVTADGWAFADRSRTRAEVIGDFYEDIRSAAGMYTVIMAATRSARLPRHS